MEYYKNDKMTVVKSIDSLVVGDKLIRKETSEIVPITGILRDDEKAKGKSSYRVYVFKGFNVQKKAMAKMFVMSFQDIKTVI